MSCPSHRHPVSLYICLSLMPCVYTVDVKCKSNKHIYLREKSLYVVYWHGFCYANMQLYSYIVCKYHIWRSILVKLFLVAKPVVYSWAPSYVMLYIVTMLIHSYSYCMLNARELIIYHLTNKSSHHCFLKSYTISICFGDY